MLVSTHIDKRSCAVTGVCGERVIHEARSPVQIGSHTRRHGEVITGVDRRAVRKQAQVVIRCTQTVIRAVRIGKERVNVNVPSSVSTQGGVPRN